jgi:hypothetical protein
MPGQPHWRVRLNGHAGTPSKAVEIFSFGFAVNADLITPAQQTAITAAAVAYFGRQATGITSTGNLDEVAFSQVGADHKQIGDTFRSAVAQPGGFANGVYQPLQIAYRVSLDDAQRGRSHRGGFYVPYPGWPTKQDTGAVDSDYCTQARDSCLTFIRAVNTTMGTAGKVCIPSQVLGNVIVSRVRVGNVMDTIRTRRNALDEVYSVGTV